MGLTLVTGRANSGKTGVVYDVVRNAAESGRLPSLLLPTYPDVVRASAEFASGHPLGIHVEQLDGWIAGLWSLGGDGRRMVTPAQRPFLVSDAIAGTPLRALIRSAGTPGFVRLVSYVARTAAEQPRDRLAATGARSAADLELVAILRAYRDSLDAVGLVEPGEATLLLSLDPPAPEGPVIMHRFSDLGAAQEALVTALGRSADVWLTLPWEEGFPATEAVGALVQRILPVAAHRHCGTNGRPGELARLEEWLYRAPEPAPSTGAVAFCTAAGVEAEAALIAQCARAAADRWGADRVAVVFRDAARHVERLRLALGGAGVAADFDVLVPASRTPFGTAIRHLLSAVSGGERGDLLAFLSSPFAGADPGVVDDLDAKWRLSRTTEAAKTLSDASRSGPAPGRALKLARRVVSRPIEPATLGDWQELADALLGAAHDAASLKSDPHAAVDAAAHRALLETVTRLSELGSGRFGHADVLMVFDQTEVSPAAAERPGHVQVTEAHRLRSRRFDAVIVGGMTAGDFSAEGRANTASQIADRILGTTRPGEQALERLLFYDVCTRARQELVLVRQTVDSEGAAKRPSVFWEEALDLYRRPEADAAPEEEQSLLAATVRLSDLERAAPALTPRRALLRAQAAAGAPGGCDARVAEAAMRAGAHRGELRDPDVLAVLAARDEFSATELELYARCPYRWFYERAVRPRSLDVVLDARTHGSLAHRVLADFYTELPERLGTHRVTPASLGAALALAGEIFDRVATSPETPKAVTLAEQDDLATVRRQVVDLVGSDLVFLPGFAPVRVEFRFGTTDPAHPDPGTAGPIDLGGFLLRGSIDRIDEGEAGLAVIDYKSGAVPKGADLVPDRHLQVGLYSAVAARLLGRPVVAGLYRSLKSGGARGYYIKETVVSGGLTSTDAVADAAEVTAIIEATLVLARDAADGIRAGAIPLRPASAKACEYCTAAGLCGGGWMSA